MIYALIVLIQVSHDSGPNNCFDFDGKAVPCGHYTTWEQIAPAKSYATKEACYAARERFNLAEGTIAEMLCSPVDPTLTR